MSSHRLAALLAVSILSACAKGEDGGLGDDDVEIDAPAIEEIDAPQVDEDAPPADLDAPDVDAPPIDAMPIDGAIIDAAPIDAPAIDAPPPIDAPPAIDAGIDAPPGPVDTCAQALDLTSAAMSPTGTTVTGTTVGYANNVQVPTACTTYTTTGYDAVYAVTVGAGAVITVTAMPTTSWDLSLYLTSTCSLTATCVIGDDSGLSGITENFAYTTTAAGTYFIIIDGWNTGASGPYSLNVRVQ